MISQPMFFPWVGMMELVGMADRYVHYDDVQFSKGSFTNRVQIKTPRGQEWLTLPLRDVHLGQEIREVRVDARKDWRRQHLEALAAAYREAPYCESMLTLVQSVYAQDTDRLCDLVVASMRALADALGARPKREAFSSELGVPGRSWERVLEVVRRFEGTEYVTAHGARGYLDHEAFERAGVSVRYIDYARRPYTQLHGAFIPYVSALDLLANLGPAAREVFVSPLVPWKEFLASCPPK